MAVHPIAGPGAGVRKYDILTALTTWALREGPVHQATALRLVALLTARYNWQLDEMSVGQAEIARLWGVTDRTVKREIKRLTGLGLLQVIRPGVKGRVARYRLDQARIADLSAPYWEAVSPEFANRQRDRHAPEAASVVRVDFGPGPEAVAPGEGASLQDWLRHLAPDAYGAWFARLKEAQAAPGVIELTCPNGFVRRYIETHFSDVLLNAAQRSYGPGVEIRLSDPEMRKHEATCPDFDAG